MNNKNGESPEDKPSEIKHYWFDITLESDEKEAELLGALYQAKELRSWANDEMKRRWSAVQGTAKTTDLLPAATAWLQEQENPLQHYTAISVLNQAVAAFNQSIKVDATGIGGQMRIVDLPTSLEIADEELTVKSRSIWQRYLKNFGRVSTIYGAVYLDGDWEEKLEEQARESGTSLDLFPFLIYSATFRRKGREWKIRFNAHIPDSKFGRQRKKQGRQKLKEQRI